MSEPRPFKSVFRTAAAEFVQGLSDADKVRFWMMVDELETDPWLNETTKAHFRYVSGEEVKRMIGSFQLYYIVDQQPEARIDILAAEPSRPSP